MSKHWEQNNKLVNNPWFKEEVSREIKKKQQKTFDWLQYVKMCNTQVKQGWEGNLQH